MVAVINCNVLRCILGLRFTDVSSVILSSPQIIMPTIIYPQANDFCDIQEKPWPHLGKILNNLSSIVVIVVFAVINITSGF